MLGCGLIAIRLSTQRSSWLEAPRSLAKRTRLPSGDQAGSRSEWVGSFVSWVGVPPLGATAKMANVWDVWSERWNAISLPFGDHAGSASRPLVSRRRLLPSLS